MVNKVFENLSKWRNLLNYQLERRADIFFSLYLNDIIASKTKVEDEWRIIPEFPIPNKVIDPKVQHNRSVKIDYLIIGIQSKKVIFLELKTDNSSRRDAQDLYLILAREAGLVQLLDGLKDIFCATTSKMKYLYLFSILREIGLVDYNNSIEEKIKNRLPGINDFIRSIEVKDNALTRAIPEILYIQPSGEDEHIINFKDISDIILNKYKDSVSIAFSNALVNWAEQCAGEFI